MKQSFRKNLIIKNLQEYGDPYFTQNFLGNSFMEFDKIKLRDILKSELPFDEKVWFLYFTAARSDETKSIALHIAKTVLPIYTKRFQNDTRPSDTVRGILDYSIGKIKWYELHKKYKSTLIAAGEANGAAFHTAYSVAFAASTAYSSGMSIFVRAYTSANSAYNATKNYPHLRKNLEDYLVSIAK